MQKIVDRGYRYVWMNRKKGPELNQLEERQVNMWGVRRNLGARSLQARIEERVLRKIGPVLKMEDTRPTKRATLGWHVPPVTPTPERKPRHGSIEYWRKILHEMQTQLNIWYGIDQIGERGQGKKKNGKES